MAESDLKRLDFHGDISLGFDILAFIILSSILACVALMTESIPILIGAMVLAPTFDPLVAVAFGVVNRDWALARKGIINSLTLFGVAFAVCLITVWILQHTPLIPPDPALLKREIVKERLIVGGYSVITALAAGAGGAIASASDRRTNLVGVVISLALVPALAAASVGFQSSGLNGWPGLALFGINVLGIFISGLLVLSFRRGAGKTKDKIDQTRKHHGNKLD